MVYRSWPTRNISIAKIARRAGSKITNTQYAEKHITMTGYIIGSSVSDLQTRIDNLQKQLYQEGKLLEIESNRFYTATAQSLSIADPHYSQSMVPFELDFVCANPFAYGPTISADIIVTSGTLTQTYTITISGTYPAEPTLTYLTPTGATTNTTTSGIKVSDIGTGEYVLWSGTGAGTYIPYSGSLTLAYDTYKVLLGDTPVNFSGVFSLLDPGQNQLQVTYMGNTVGGTFRLSYAPRYL